MSLTQRAGAPSWSESAFDAGDGTRLHHLSCVPAEPRAAVAVVHGYGEHSGRYRHVLEAFAAAGLATHALDLRGHGKAAGPRAAILRFEEYHSDVIDFLARVRAASPGLPLFLLGHSNGGLIVTSLLLSAQAPKDVRGVVLSAPYFRLRIVPSRVQLFLAHKVGRFLPALAMKSPLRPEMFTRDPAMLKATAEDPLYLRIVTPRYFTESQAAQVRVFSEAASLKLPLLMLQGDADPVVDPHGARDFFKVAGSADKALHALPGMLHEVLNEIGREKLIAQIASWIHARSGTAAKEAV